MGHPQPLTPMQMDNTTVLGIINNKVIKKLKGQWTQNTISSVTEKVKDNFDTTGPQAKKTMATM
jgi:hypothetical protein